MKFLIATSLIGLSVSTALALPESQMGTRLGNFITTTVVTDSNIQNLRAKLAKTDIPVLDQLWNSRQDLISGACNSTSNNCRVISVFRGSNSGHPIVLLPGFTGYRKMYIEQIYDLLQAGYGPVYISDFAGTGDSFKPELAAGAPQRTAGYYMQSLAGAGQVASSSIQRISGAANVNLIQNVIAQLPLGIGYIQNFSNYVADVNLIMSTAVSQNPNSKIIISSLSMSGLSVLEALASQNTTPTWISRVDRIVLESPMVRVKGSNIFGLSGTALISLVVAGGMRKVNGLEPMSKAQGLSPFMNKALGYFDPENTISHSPARLTLTDSLRTWNGAETLGATWTWADEELRHQYSTEVFHLDANALNYKTAGIGRVLQQFAIPLIVVASEGDGIVDTAATKRFLADLSSTGYTYNNLCSFQTAKHVIDQESDKYRVPYMTMLTEQKNGTLQASYGSASVNEVMTCRHL